MGLGRCLGVAILSATYGSLLPYIFLIVGAWGWRSSVTLTWIAFITAMLIGPGILALGAIRNEAKGRRRRIWVQVELIAIFAALPPGWVCSDIWNVAVGGSFRWTVWGLWPIARSPARLLIIVGVSWLASAVVAALVGLAWRTPGDRCADCGYLLRGLLSRRCPECGHRITPDEVRDLNPNPAIAIDLAGDAPGPTPP